MSARTLRALQSNALTAPPPQGLAAALVGNDSDFPGPEEPSGSGDRSPLNGRKDTTLRLKTG